VVEFTLGKKKTSKKQLFENMTKFVETKKINEYKAFISMAFFH
jgi:hypothetical protein